MGSSPTDRIVSPIVQLVERVTVNHCVVGSSPTRGVHQSVAQFGSALRLGRKGRRFESCHSDFGPVTQLGEYFVCIEKVAGSSPVRSTKKNMVLSF